MKISKKYWALFLLFLILISIYVYFKLSEKRKIIHLGIFSGSMYDVPIMKSYKIIDEAIKSFEADNPGIKIKYDYGIIKKDYSEWLSAKILNGKMPDVFVVLDEDFNAFSSIGILEQLDNKMKKDKKFDKRRFYDQAIKLGRFEDKQYALPMEMDPVLLFVNKTLMKKEGITIDKNNWTWEEFYKICKKVTKDTTGDGILDQFGVVNFTWQNLIYTNGQELFSPDGKTSEFSKKGVVEAIEFYKKLYNLNSNIKVTPEDFSNGNVLFKPFPFSWYRVYNTYPYRLIKYGGFEWECIKLPRGPRGKNSSEIKSFLIGISSQSENKKMAWEFLKFLTNNPETQMNVFKYSQGVPVLKVVTESTKADEELRQYNPEKEVSIDRIILGEIIEDSIVTPKFKKYEKAMSVADLNINHIIVENNNIEQSLIKLDKELTEFLNAK